MKQGLRLNPFPFWIASVALALGALPLQSSQAYFSGAKTHLIAEGETAYGDIAPLYSCLAYQGCELTTFTLGADRRLHIYTNKDIPTILTDYANCDLRGVKANYLVESHPDGTQTPIDLPSSSTPKIDLSPGVLGLHPKNRVKKIAEKIASLNKLSALDHIIRGFRIKTYGYNTAVGDVGKKAAATVLHGTKMITFSDSINHLEMIRATRHEFDHVLQFQIASSCRGESTFSSHDRRERAAYLNETQLNPALEEWLRSQIKRYPNH